MDTLVRPPAPPATDVGSSPRRGRWLLLVFVVLVFVALTVGSLWVSNVEPLGRGSTGLGPASVHVSEPSPPPTVTSRFVDALGVSGIVLRIPVSTGMRFTYEVTIRNDGSVPVQIVDVGSGDEVGQVTRHVVGFQPDHPGGELDNVQPFRPFTMSPGEEAGLVMEVRVADDRCATEDGTGTSWFWEPVTFRVFGFPMPERHQDVETGTEIELVGQGPGC